MSDECALFGALSSSNKGLSLNRYIKKEDLFPLNKTEIDQNTTDESSFS